MSFRLSLDLGANSIGWSVLDIDERFEVTGLRAAGVRVFPDGRDPKTATSLAAERRLARSMRRRRDRYLQRRQALLNALKRHGLMPQDPDGGAEIASLDPYRLRGEALKRELTPYELGRVIFHLNQRRGFKSNRKVDRSNEESGKISDAARRLRHNLADDGFMTVGAWLAHRHARREPVRARLQGAGASAAYSFYPTRELIETEFDLIWSEQTARNNRLTREACEELRQILFHQRPLKTPRVGRCWLEPNEERAPKALPSTQTFRIAQDLVHLTIRQAGEPDRPLTTAEREAVLNVLTAGKDRSFDQVRKLLKLRNGETFNFEGGKTGLKGCNVAARLAGKNGPFAHLWPTLSLEDRDRVVQALIAAENSVAAVDALMAMGLPREMAVEAEKISLPEGHASLSNKAIRAILPHMLAGLKYSAAVQAAGYAHHSDDRDGVQFETLPYYGEVLSERLGTGSHNLNDPPELFYGRAPNPTVHVALNQLRHVVNDIIARYGRPDQIVVEVLRELGRSAFDRSRVKQEQRINEKRREQYKAELVRLGLPTNGTNLALMRLWHEQASDPKDRVCPYSGRLIGLADLFSGAFEQDHILPFSITLDDSFNNRVLVLREANRAKSRQTPFAAFGTTAEWPAILERAKLLPSAKRWRFAPDALSRWQGESGDFLARHMTDSAYLARLARLYLRAICHPDQVWCVPGRLTGLLRAKLGLHSDVVLGKGAARKDRTDHRHHAIDAVVVGLIDRSLLQRVATAARRAQDTDRVLLDDLGEPWPGFANDVATRIRAIVVSHKPDIAAQGRLHNETAYGEVTGAAEGEPNVSHRVPISSLADWAVSDLDGAIADPSLREKLKVALEQPSASARAAALASIVHAPGERVRRVKIRERLEGTALISSRKDGAPYKRVKLDANHRAEIWRLPPADGKRGQTRILIIPMLTAATEAAERRKGIAKDTRPHPAAKLVMRLHKNDCVAFGVGENRRVLRVVKFSSGTITLAEVHESGALKARDADRADPFRYVQARVSRFAAEQARKVRIDPAGKIYDPGPQPW
jgi:CRISPR-associated endonuclease Csn1